MTAPPTAARCPSTASNAPTTRPRHSSTVSSARTAAPHTPLWPPLSGLGACATQRHGRLLSLPRPRPRGAPGRAPPPLEAFERAIHQRVDQLARPVGPEV